MFKTENNYNKPVFATHLSNFQASDVKLSHLACDRSGQILSSETAFVQGGFASIRRALRARWEKRREEKALARAH